MTKLETVGLTKTFEGVTAVNRVDLEVTKGQIVGVIGPNGSGKTTLVNLITGLLRPNAGEIRCGDRAWRWLPPHRIAKLGVTRTFQNIRLFRELSVVENVEVMAATCSRGDWRDRSRRLLEELDLREFADRPAGALPHGLQRRTEIARALAAGPDFLLLDEPAAGLNETESEDLRRRLLQIREQFGCGILLIDHDVRLVMNTCEHVVVLNDGRVISRGEPERVRSDPAVIEAYLG